jgi:hypothetical protein
VYLNDIADYKGMNEVYKGRFGKNPPVRTTVAVAKGGVPGDSLVEMDCIAYIFNTPYQKMKRRDISKAFPPAPLPGPGARLRHSRLPRAGRRPKARFV